ncbi:MAG: RNA methyltransferase [Lachnospiraceae bacterium]|nr:RNA methyltransferase [Lachnospiraceae bacterium]
MITSLSNPLVRRVSLLNKKASLRKEEGLFVVEGRRFAEEIPADRLEQAFASEAFLETEEGASLARRLRAETVSEAVMEKMSDTRTPQGILALVRMQETPPEAWGPGPLLLLERVQDPGNLGTIFRIAEAAGAGGIILDEETADPYSPKVLRSTMGGIFRVPFRTVPRIGDEVKRLQREGVRVYAAHLQGSSEFDRVTYPPRCAFLLGNEGSGLTDEVSALADERVRIPMEGRAESLNVAVAGALLLYEAYRQRRNG